MRIVTRTISVGQYDGFRNDVLNREEFGHALRSVFVASDESLVVSLSAKWGEGKTTFAKMWAGLMRNNGAKVLYVDAFAEDYEDDAFIVLAGAITSLLQELATEDDAGEIRELIRRAARISRGLLSWSARIAVKAATLGVVDASQLGPLVDVRKDMGDSTSDVVGSIIEERLLGHAKAKQSVAEYRTLLCELAAKVSARNDGPTDQAKEDAGGSAVDEANPLVIVIDELDRCRPSFAVHIIEQLKHFFAVENVKFLLVMNREQLQQSICSVYGAGIDAATYLKKFIDLEASLPRQGSLDGKPNQVRYVHHLAEQCNFDPDPDKQAHNRVVQYLAEIAAAANLSLRQVEQTLAELRVFYTVRRNDMALHALAVALAALKVVEPKLFARVLEGSATHDSVATTLALPDPSVDGFRSVGLVRIADVVALALMNDEEYYELGDQHISRALEQKLPLDRGDTAQHYARTLSSFGVS